MSENGLNRNPKDKPKRTNESIHSSVRILLGTTLWDCEALKKYDRVSTTDPSSIIWRLLHKDGKATRIQLPEESFCDSQRRILYNWMKAQKEEMHSWEGPKSDRITLREIFMPLFEETEDWKKQALVLQVKLGS